ncbi:MAG: DUF1232 domain-containing protein [Candidatus Binatia bacterium]
MARLLLLLAAGIAFYLWLRPPRPAATARRGRLPLIGAALLALAYLVSPIDLIPDVTPIGLVDDLIILVTTGWWIYQQWKNRPQPSTTPPPPGDAGPAWDPHRVLDVPRGASRAEITRAYREQMKRYHPDRVSGLGEELQDVAHRKTLEIQRAYIELTER